MKKLLLVIFILMSLPVSGRDGIVRLVVTGDCDSQNMAPKRNVTVRRMDDRWNRRTTFAQTLDGSRGIRLVFDHPGENILHFSDVIELDTTGLVIERDPLTSELTMFGIDARRNIKSWMKSEPVQPVVRSISELTDADINTYVEIRDLDFVFKDGSYANVHEPCTDKMDGWATLLRDAQGHSIYMLVNMDCPWRRTGRSIPQGTVNVRGILVHETNRRFGNLGRYSIRPLDETCIVPVARQSVWKTVVGWEKAQGSQCSLDFELSGSVSDLFKNGVKNDKIYNDEGNIPSLLWTDSGSEVRVYSGFNSVSKDADGTVKNGAIMFIAPTANWFVWTPDGRVADSRAFYVQVNTSKFKSGRLQLTFEWSAGTADGNKANYFPVDWRVEFSTDGKVWAALMDDASGDDAITLHSVPWNDTKIKGSSHDMKLSAGLDVGMGPQQHSFTLPDSALGCKSLYIRICPSSTYIAKPRVQFETTYRDEIVSQTAKFRESWIRFDSIRIDYLK